MNSDNVFGMLIGFMFSLMVFIVFLCVTSSVHDYRESIRERLEKLEKVCPAITLDKEKITDNHEKSKR